MILKIITIILLVIGMVLIGLGLILKKKKVTIYGVLALILITILWIVIIINGLSEENTQLLFTENSINNTIENNIINTENAISDNTEDISSKFFNKDSLYLEGKISKIEDNKIYFFDKNNKKYVLTNNEQIKYIDGRTSENYLFNDIKENYYINISAYQKTCYLFKNIEGEELKKELLISLSLPNSVNMMRTGVDSIKEVRQLGNNQAIVTFVISDLISSE